jgi:PAS domain S-box-containing protein
MWRMRSLIRPEIVILTAGLVMLALMIGATLTVQQIFERTFPLAQIGERIAAQLSAADHQTQYSHGSASADMQAMLNALARAKALARALRDSGATEVGYIDTRTAPEVQARAALLFTQLDLWEQSTLVMLPLAQGQSGNADWQTQYAALYQASLEANNQLKLAIEREVERVQRAMFDYGILLTAAIGVIFAALMLMWMRNRRTQALLNQELEDKIHARTVELARERNLLRTLIDNVPDLIYAKDSDSKFVLVNAAMAKSMGAADPSELLGKSDFDFHPLELAQEFRADEIALMTQGKPLLDKVEFIYTPTGEQLWFSSIKVPLRDAQGEVIGLVGVGRDITAARAQALKLRESETQHRRIVENAHEGIIVTNAEHKIVFHNARATEILGYSAEELIGQTPLLVAMPENADAARQRLAQRAAGVRSEFDSLFRRKGGEEGWMHVIATPIRDDFGSYAGTLYMFTDVTARRRAEEALRESEALYRSLIEAMPQCVTRKDRAGRIIYGNARFFEDVQASPDQILGKTDFDFHPRELAEQYWQDDLRVLNGETIDKVEEHERGDGKRILVRVIKLPTYDEQNNVNGMQVIFWDVTAERQAEEKLRRQKEYLDALHATTLGLIGRLKMNDLLQALTCRAAMLVGTQHGYSYVTTRGQTEMEMNVGIGIFEQMIGTKARRGVGVTGTVWEMGQAVVIDDYQTWQGHLAKPGNDQLHSIVAIPLRSGDEVIGVFGVAHTEAQRRFDETDVEMLTRFANLAAIALDNARLYAAAEQEIAERQRASEQLHERQELLTRVLETVADGIYIVNQNGQMTYANRATENIVGAPRAEIETTRYNDARWQITTVDGKPFPEAEQPFVRVTSSGEPVYDVEQAIQRADGSRVIVSINAAPLHDADGRIIGEVASMTDVTARKRAEQELRRQKELLQAIFDNIPVMIGVFDRDGNYSLVNREWETRLGYALDEMNDAEIWANMYPEEQQRAAMRALMSAPTAGWRDFQTVVYDGRVIDTSWTVAHLSDGMTIAFGQDITSRKEVDRLKNEFISTVSHELRTPLTSIRGSLGLIAGGAAGPIPDRAQNMIDIAYKNSERLVRLINDILDIEKIESGKMAFHFKPLEVMPLLTQVLEANRGYAEQYQVSLKITEALPGAQVNADADRLTQVLTNLISNAVKFSPRGEEVEIGVRRVARGIRYSVRDFGPGIPREFQSRIFQKFAQADSSTTRQKGGTGLGLSIAKAIVEKHGGVMGFDTILGVGTTFYFEIPEWQEPVSPSSTVNGAKPRILICEDNPDVARLLSAMLEQSDLETDVAYTAAQAKTLLAQHRYAALTLDLKLPDQDGVSLIRELRAAEATCALPIVVVAADAEQGRQELNGDALCVINWLQKPIDRTQLVRTVTHAVRRSAKTKPHILHVEDDADVLQVVQAILQETALVSSARDLAHAREMLVTETFDLVLLDPTLPDGSGIDLLPLLRSQRGRIPVVLFSARDSEPQLQSQVNAALVKSRTSNQELIETITQLIFDSQSASAGARE